MSPVARVRTGQLLLALLDRMVGAGGHQNFWVAPDECLPNVACPDLTDTPTLDWNPAAGAGSYLVCLALDPDLTNIVKTYRTQYTQLTPRESLLDNQAGQAYYWLARPCKTPSRLRPPRRLRLPRRARVPQTVAADLARESFE